MSVIDYLDPDEMVEEYTDKQQDSDLMGVREESLCFVRATDMLRCEWCNTSALHPSQVLAVKPRNHSVVLCTNCVPGNEVGL